MMQQEAPLPPPSSHFSGLNTEEEFRESLFHRIYEIDGCANTSSPPQSLVYSFSLKKLQLLPLSGNTAARNMSYKRGVRGGMLCDEPGLGKTITMMAVILKSIGAETLSMMKIESNVELSERKGLRSPSSRRRSISHMTLLSSKTTLIISPDTLLTHWRDQINLHINVTMKIKIFVDLDLSLPLPSAEDIAQFDLFITTFRSILSLSSRASFTPTLPRRLSNEWSHGKPQCKLDEKKGKTFEEEFQGDLSASIFISPNKQKSRPHSSSSFQQQPQQHMSHLSELLKIHWLRVVIDEGHQLGRSSTTNAILLATLLEAERRWILTGTPTRSFSSEVTTTALRHLYQVTSSPHHPSFSF
jgi:SNF2 family DNA or RNA helicase